MSQSNPPPLHALSRALRDVIFEQASTPATEILLAGFLDGYISQCVGSCVQVKTLYGPAIPPLAYIMVFGPASSRKSTMGKPFQAHFDDYHRRYVTETAEAWSEYRASLESWKAEKAGILKTIKKQASSGRAADDCLRQRLIELEKSVPKMPPSPPSRFEDTTLAPWLDAAARNPATFFYGDEGSGVLNGMDKDMVGALCGYWSAMQPSHARSHTGIQIVNVMPTVILSIQPSVLVRFLTATPKGLHFVSGGCASRFIFYGVSEAEFARQSIGISEDRSSTALQAALERSEHFFRLQDQLNRNGGAGKKVLELSDSAKREMRDLEKYLHSIRRNAGSDGELALIDKTAENILRHAARHHEFNGIDGLIGVSEIADSAEWLLWSLDNYVELMESEQTTGRSADKDAETLWDLMLYGLHIRDGKITRRQLAEEAFNVGLVRSTHFSDALGVLCQRDLATLKDGYVYWEKPNRVSHLISTFNRR